MKIGIDARFYGTLGKGLGRYTEQLIENLEKIDSKNHYVVFLRPENYAEYTPRRKNFKKVRVDIEWYSLKEQFVYPFILKKYHFDLVHFPHFNIPILYRREFVVTLHDLILFHYPTLRSTTLSPIFYGVKYAAYRAVLGSALRRARHIVAVSRFTKEDILKHFRIPKNKITVTYQANSDLVENREQKNTKNLSHVTCHMSHVRGILHPYILYVGNAYPHKNLDTLVRAFAALEKKNIQLVLVGKKDYFYTRLESFVRKKKIRHVVFAGEVSDAKLERLYRGAATYVFPSLYEGFGLPLLEAMARGVPVISSKAASLPEVCGDAAYYFDPKQASSLTEALEKVLGDAELRLALVQKGKEHARKFSWEILAEKTLDIYQNCRH